ncbi:MAG: hypothetical protein ACI3YT_00325 [Prevotella sp.]
MRRFFVVLSVLLASTLAMAETTGPLIGIVNRKDCGSFWRYDFNYETVDADGETPIVLSAAIFMTPKIHDKELKAKGCGLINHYTITDDTQRPSNVKSGFTLEGILTNSNYFMIESDGFGFGIDVNRNQKYLQGRAAARVNIDAFLAGRKLLEAEGYEYENVVLNLGYSQGGNSGMWVNRLVAEGYRSDELPRIDYCIIGGGPYDMYSHYRKLAEDNMSQYPVALPLILSGMIDAGGYKVKNEDVFNDDFVQYLPELFDSKEHDTDYINNFIYEKYGSADDKSLPIDKIVKPVFFDENSETMQDIIYHLKQNSLVYDSWKPEKTDLISFVHSSADEVVPFLNQESMEAHLLANGYESFDIDDSSTERHTDTGTYYVLRAAVLLSKFVPSGMENVFSRMPAENTHDIYTIDGRLVRKNTTLSDAFRSLPKGVYVINGRKLIKE